MKKVLAGLAAGAVKKRRTLAFALGTVQNFVFVQNFVLWKTLQLQNGGKIGEIRGALPPREVQPLPAKIQLYALSTLIYNLHLSCTLHSAQFTAHCALLNTVQHCSTLLNTAQYCSIVPLFYCLTVQDFFLILRMTWFNTCTAASSSEVSCTTDF